MQGWFHRALEIAAFTVALTATTIVLRPDAADPPVAAPQAVEPYVSPVPWFDTTDREAVVAGFTAEFGSQWPELTWDGDHGRCDAGTSTAPFRDATLRRVNYYRAMAGVVAAVEEEPAFTAKAQMAAMMMSAEGELTHDPSESFACYDTVGHEAAANSNLYLGRNGPSAIDGYIEDPGARNVDVGHRATILHPPTRSMGVGDVGPSSASSSANALWVFDDRVFDEESPAERPDMREERRFVAWPPRGYVPAPIVYPRWSFTIAGHDFSRASVELYRVVAGAAPQPVPVQVVNRSGAPGHVPLPTIVWEPAPGTIEVDAARDQLFLVVVDGVVVTGASRPADGGPAVTTSFAYPVTILGAEAGPELTTGAFLSRLGPDRTG